MNINYLNYLDIYSINTGNIIQKIEGANSTVLHCDNSNGEEFGIKIYKGENTRCVRSWRREIKSLKFLNQNNFNKTVSLIDYDKSTYSILYKWVQSNSEFLSNFGKKCIVNSLVDLHNLYQKNKSFYYAIDSIIFFKDLKKQILTRSEIIFANKFIDKKTKQKLLDTTTVISNTKFTHEKLKINTYSFSDIGLHNLLIDNNMNPYFIDLEFFGKDSKVKLIADLFSHPLNSFSSSELNNIRHKLCLADVETQQIIEIMPGIALKWAFISAKRLQKESDNNFDVNSSVVAQVLNYCSYSLFLLEINEFEKILTFNEFKYST